MIKVKIYWIVILLITLLLVFKFISSYSYDRGSEENNSYYEILTDSLKTTRNKLGNEIAKREVLSFKNESDIKKLAGISEEVKTLKREVRKYKGKLKNATLIKNKTNISGGSVTEVVADSTEINFPVYKTSWEDKWSKGFIKARFDSIFYAFKSHNEFVLTIGSHKKSLFGKRKTIATIKNLNPNTFTEEVITFEITTKRKRFGIGILGGIGFTNFTTSTPFIGVGVYYSVFQF